MKGAISTSSCLNPDFSLADDFEALMAGINADDSKVRTKKQPEERQQETPAEESEVEDTPAEETETEETPVTPRVGGKAKDKTPRRVFKTRRAGDKRAITDSAGCGQEEKCPCPGMSFEERRDNFHHSDGHMQFLQSSKL